VHSSNRLLKGDAVLCNWLVGWSVIELVDFFIGWLVSYGECLLGIKASAFLAHS
jgi:hypothetical protein